MKNRDKVIEILQAVRNTTSDIEKQADRICDLFGVSNRRELLLAYLKYQNSPDYVPETKIDDEVDKFLSQ